MNKTIIIFSGYNIRGIIALCRLLDSLKIKASIIAKDITDPIFRTKYKTWVEETRESINLNVTEIKRICIKYQKKYKSDSSIIIPTTEFLNRFLLKNIECFNKESIEVPLVNDILYKKISDKITFKNWCRKNGIKTPPDIQLKIENIPLVAKPKRYGISSKQIKPYIIKNEIEYRSFIDNESIDDFYYEKFINGCNYYLLFHISKDGGIKKFSQKNLVQQANGCSIIAATVSDIHLDPICEKFERLLLSENFHGLIMIEVRKKNEDLYMIEANPRLWGPMQLVVDFYPQLLINYLIDNGININSDTIQISSINKQKKIYFWYGGLIKDQYLKLPTTYYNYTTLNSDLSELLYSDVYLRKDTLELFRAEIDSKGKK